MCNPARACRNCVMWHIAHLLSLERRPLAGDLPEDRVIFPELTRRVAVFGQVAEGDVGERGVLVLISEAGCRRLR
jgi:hypothetical protein